MAGRAWGRADPPQDADNRYLVQEQKDIMQEQDDALDAMYHTMRRTKDIAVAIGEETEEHIGLLDEIDGKADRNESRLKNVTRQVEDVEIQSSTKCLWLVICILFLGLIVTIILAFQLPT